jgi:hypothetical protein
MSITTQKPAQIRDCDFERYAVFWMPQQGSRLAAFGARWFGAPAESAAALGLGAGDVDAAIAEPKRYGLHATMLAPFRLQPGKDVQALIEQLERFAAARPPVPLCPLRLERLGSFLALVTTAQEASIRSLHIQCMFALDGFRGPASSDEQHRRETGAGESTQKLLLAQWGYAHVMHLFRFHVTLTGRLDDQAAARFGEALAGEVKTLNAEPFALDTLCLVGDPGKGEQFQPICRFQLAASSVD